MTTSSSASAVIDLRSDTLTRPSDAMRRAIADAIVGDDVYGEDPTVNQLETEVAALFGKEAALFVPTGSMGNQVSIRLSVEPGTEFLCDAEAHVVSYELGTAAALHGLQSRTVVGERGVLDPDQVAAQIRDGAYGYVPTRMVAVENTHNRGGGTVYPLSTLTRLRELTAAAGVRLHCDGARIWNAHVATGVALDSYGALFDTMSVCLSKGLGAPVGSLVLASAADIVRARIIRKRMGAGMRQVGVLAAAGLYAVRNNIARLADDHARARRLAEAVASAAAIIDPASVVTNIVMFDVTPLGTSSTEFARRAGEAGVALGVVDAHRVRAVTHLDVNDAEVDRAATIIAELAARMAQE